MPKPGVFDEAKAMKQGLVPAAPLGRIINRWALNYADFDASSNTNFGAGTAMHPTTLMATRTGVHQDIIRKIRMGKKEWIEFDSADKIVCEIDPFLWHTDPDLSRIYDSFDFSNLDLCRPPSSDADELPLLDGLTGRTAAAVLGVCDGTLDRQRRLRRDRLEQLGEVVAA